MLIVFEKMMKLKKYHNILYQEVLIKMAKIFDKLINLCKWPLAIYMLISLPALISSIDFFNFKTFKYLAFGAGFFMYFTSRTMMDSSVKTTMQTVAHELTHAFFALLTFHKVSKISIDADNKGGEITFAGEGNWLITIAPYFFPLFAMIYMIIISFLPNELIFNGILGYFLGYHTDTVASQIHEKQTDLPKVGYLFCATFLPGANLWIIGSIMAFNIRNWEGIRLYFNLINYLNVQNFHKLWDFIF